MTTVTRTYHPGSEWLYYKLYTGPKTADFILEEFIAPLAKKLLKKQLIDKWFFIRYFDPDFHLRVRFKVSNTDAISDIIKLMNEGIKYYIKEDLIWKLQIDTYQREIERYGDKTMAAAETLFFHDSIMITKLLSLIDDTPEGEELRWLFGIKAIDVLLTDFEYSEEKKLYLLEQLKINFCSEFNMNKTLKKQLDKKCISHEKKIEFFITSNQNVPIDFSDLFKIITSKSKQINAAVIFIKDTIHPSDLNSFLASHIHMIMNRLFRDKNRLYEMVIYYFLFKYYKTAIGRKKFKTQVLTP